MLTNSLVFIQYFAAVLLAISLFFAPFIGYFWWSNRKVIAEAGPHFNYFMERFFVSRQADLLVLLWAFSEALIWFVIPEFLLFLVIFMRVDRKFDLIKYDLIGTIAGTIIGFFFRIPERIFVHLPFVRPKMLDQVNSWYDQNGIYGLLHQPFSGVPYKVFVHQAEYYHFSLIVFIVLAVVVRMFRYFIAYEVTKAAYPLFHRFVRRHYAVLFLVAIALFTLLLRRVVQISS